MAQTLLQIVQTICDELGLNRPAVIVSSTDTQVRQIYALVNRSLRELQQNYNWTFLQTEYDLYVAQPTQSFGLVTQGSYVISGIPFNSFGLYPASDFSDDFNGDFGGAATTNPIPPLLLSDPALWVISGQNIIVNTRLVSIVANSISQTYTITMDQPATGTLANTVLTFSQDTYPEPVDFSRFINQTWWDRTNRWALMGPDSPQVDQWHRSGIVTIGPRRHFRQIGYNGISGDFNNDFNTDFSVSGGIKNYRIWPAPGATDTPINLVYEYISSNIVISSRGIPQPSFQADTDFPIIDPNMLILDAKWRMWQIKGFDYASLQMEARDYIDRAYAQDGGNKTLSLTGNRGNFITSSGLVQDGNYPGPGNGDF